MRLAPQAEPFNDADGSGVFRIQPCKDPVETEPVEAERDDGACRLGRIALAGIGWIEDIADLGLECGLAGKLEADLTEQCAIFSPDDGTAEDIAM